MDIQCLETFPGNERKDLVHTFKYTDTVGYELIMLIPHASQPPPHFLHSLKVSTQTTCQLIDPGVPCPLGILRMQQPHQLLYLPKFENLSNPKSSAL